MLGTACEYQFYCTVSDYAQRIFYSLDIRDMGVDLMLLYEYSNRQVGHNKYSDSDLMGGKRSAPPTRSMPAGAQRTTWW